VRFCIINWRLAAGRPDALTPPHSPNNCSCANAPDSYGRQNIPHLTLSCAQQTYCTSSLRHISILPSHLHLRAQYTFLSSGSPRKYFPLGCTMRATRPVHITKLNKELQVPIRSVVYPLHVRPLSLQYTTVPPATISTRNKCRVSNNQAAGTSRYRCVLT